MFKKWGLMRHRRVLGISRWVTAAGLLSTCMVPRQLLKHLLSEAEVPEAEADAESDQVPDGGGDL